MLTKPITDRGVVLLLTDFTYYTTSTIYSLMSGPSAIKAEVFVV